jgi:uncharacterized protein (DUF1015 family)
MAEIRPFRGVHYNRENNRDISSVICPPYDIISPQMDEELHNRNAYNFIRIEYNRLQTDDSDTNNSTPARRTYLKNGWKRKCWLR